MRNKFLQGILALTCVLTLFPTMESTQVLNAKAENVLVNTTTYYKAKKWYNYEEFLTTNVICNDGATVTDNKGDSFGSFNMFGTKSWYRPITIGQIRNLLETKEIEFSAPDDYQNDIYDAEFSFVVGSNTKVQEIKLFVWAIDTATGKEVPMQVEQYEDGKEVKPLKSNIRESDRIVTISMETNGVTTIKVKPMVQDTNGTYKYYLKTFQISKYSRYIHEPEWQIANKGDMIPADAATMTVAKFESGGGISPNDKTQWQFNDDTVTYTPPKITDTASLPSWEKVSTNEFDPSKGYYDWRGNKNEITGEHKITGGQESPTNTLEDAKKLGGASVTSVTKSGTGWITNSYQPKEDNKRLVRWKLYARNWSPGNAPTGTDSGWISNDGGWCSTYGAGGSNCYKSVGHLASDTKQNVYEVYKKEYIPALESKDNIKKVVIEIEVEVSKNTWKAISDFPLTLKDEAARADFKYDFKESGSYRLKATASNGAGYSKVADWAYFKIDKHAPIINGELKMKQGAIDKGTVAEKVWTNPNDLSLSYRINSSDAHSGLKSGEVEITTNSLPNVPNNPIVTETAKPLTSNAQQDVNVSFKNGKITFLTTMSDMVGNVGKHIKEFWLDGEKPNTIDGIEYYTPQNTLAKFSDNPVEWFNTYKQSTYIPSYGSDRYSGISSIEHNLNFEVLNIDGNELYSYKKETNLLTKDSEGTLTKPFKHFGIWTYNYYPLNNKELANATLLREGRGGTLTVTTTVKDKVTVPQANELVSTKVYKIDNAAPIMKYKTPFLKAKMEEYFINRKAYRVSTGHHSLGLNISDYIIFQQLFGDAWTWDDIDAEAKKWGFESFWNGGSPMSASDITYFNLSTTGKYPLNTSEASKELETKLLAYQLHPSDNVNNTPMNVSIKDIHSGIKSWKVKDVNSNVVLTEGTLPSKNNITETLVSTHKNWGDTIHIENADKTDSTGALIWDVIEKHAAMYDSKISNVRKYTTINETLKNGQIRTNRVYHSHEVYLGDDKFEYYTFTPYYWWSSDSFAPGWYTESVSLEGDPFYDPNNNFCTRVTGIVGAKKCFKFLGHQGHESLYRVNLYDVKKYEVTRTKTVVTDKNISFNVKSNQKIQIEVEDNVFNGSNKNTKIFDTPTSIDTPLIQVYASTKGSISKTERTQREKENYDIELDIRTKGGAKSIKIYEMKVTNNGADEGVRSDFKEIINRTNIPLTPTTEYPAAGYRVIEKIPMKADNKNIVFAQYKIEVTDNFNKTETYYSADYLLDKHIGQEWTVPVDSGNTTSNLVNPSLLGKTEFDGWQKNPATNKEWTNSDIYYTVKFIEALPIKNNLWFLSGSGIKTFKPNIDGNATLQSNLETFTDYDSTYKDRTGKFPVISMKNRYSTNKSKFNGVPVDIYHYFEDYAGNATSKNYVFPIDTIKPTVNYAVETVSINPENGKEGFEDVLTINVTVDDKEAGPRRIDYCVEMKEKETDVATFAGCTWNTLTYLNSKTKTSTSFKEAIEIEEEGYANIQMIAYDNVGNPSGITILGPKQIYGNYEYVSVKLEFKAISQELDYFIEKFPTTWDVEFYNYLRIPNKKDADYDEVKYKLITQQTIKEKINEYYKNAPKPKGTDDLKTAIKKIFNHFQIYNEGLGLTQYGDYFGGIVMKD